MDYGINVPRLINLLRESFKNHVLEENCDELVKTSKYDSINERISELKMRVHDRTDGKVLKLSEREDIYNEVERLRQLRIIDDFSNTEYRYWVEVEPLSVDDKIIKERFESILSAIRTIVWNLKAGYPLCESVDAKYHWIVFGSENENSSTIAKENTTESIEQNITKESLVAELKKQRKSKKEIAQELDRRFPGCTNAELGKLLGEPGDPVTYAALRKRGQRARGKA